MLRFDCARAAEETVAAADGGPSAMECGFSSGNATSKLIVSHAPLLGHARRRRSRLRTKVPAIP